MHGRPVVTTSVGVMGLESFVGHGLFVCDSVEDFADTVVNLFSDLPKTQKLGEESLRQAQLYLEENRRAFAEALSKAVVS